MRIGGEAPGGGPILSVGIKCQVRIRLPATSDRQFGSRAEKPSRAADDGTRTVRFILSDASVDRMGDSISAAGWELDAYRRNPVVLWAHDSSQPPIGKMTSVFISGDRLIGDARFAPPEVYEFADQIYRLITAGYIKAGSVGFVPLDYEFSDRRQGGIDFKSQELLEFSIVPVPANANALIEARGYRGHREPTMRELGGQLGRLLIAARLRAALPPRRTTYAERVAIAAALRWGE
jgi:HK97 family phage prohead protease